MTGLKSATGHKGAFCCMQKTEIVSLSQGFIFIITVRQEAETHLVKVLWNVTQNYVSGVIMTARERQLIAYTTQYHGSL